MGILKSEMNILTLPSHISTPLYIPFYYPALKRISFPSTSGADGRGVTRVSDEGNAAG